MLVNVLIENRVRKNISCLIFFCFVLSYFCLNFILFNDKVFIVLLIYIDFIKDELLIIYFYECFIIE